MRHGSHPDDTAPTHPLTHVIDELAHLLPAQGPISIFIHHNTLHAFEHLPFEEAVETAAARLGCEPFLAESRYRDKLKSGRILARDVETLLAEQLGSGGDLDVAGVGSRFDLWRSIVLHSSASEAPGGRAAGDRGAHASTASDVARSASAALISRWVAVAAWKLKSS